MTLARERPFRIRASVEQLVLVAAVFWLLAGNLPFLTTALHGRSLADPAGAGFALALVLALVSLHVLLLGLVANRHTVKPLVALLTLVTALATWFTSRYGTVLDPSMLRNVLRTDVAEASELIGWPLALHLLLFAVAPIALLGWVQVLERPRWRAAITARLALLGGASVVLVAAVLLSFQPLSSSMRLNKELRYRITPANVLWSLGSAVAGDLRGAARPREPIGLDARPGPRMAARERPLVLVLVVGETARAANWGLAGYARDTTPRLRAQPVLDFGAVQACGTNTEVSVPCLFAPVGRRDHDEARIRGQESLLHVLARAGVAVHWRDNQSGCKGVCDGLPGDRPTPASAPGLCEGDRCLDEALIVDLDARLERVAGTPGTQLWVLHMLGNHGPAYFRRHPATFAAFTPECRDDDLGRCTPESITNAYDDALRYTDEVLARAIDRLAAHAASVDSALLYVSDHGESLGEHGLFLHGLPWSVAPDVQKQVPMVFWASSGFERGAGLPAGCLNGPLRERARAGGVAHDHVFHTVLGLLDVRTVLHEPVLDLVAPCRGDLVAAR
ncbi:MAG: phosphoethanolamine transferase domain-containing protein [Ideonella sp.]|nr:phosphoethanolamine transferase domain-containing protein [Ideonella sp.]